MVKYTSIQTVLYDLSTVLPEEEVNENYVLDWAYKAVGKTGAHKILEENVVFVQVDEHTATLPNDVCYLQQIAYKLNWEQVDKDAIRKILGEDTT